MLKPISCTIISGFLGSGKTTLIRYLLDNCLDKKIALIINEFGEMGFDACMLKECSDQKCVKDGVIELANGCICCTVGEDFIPAMEKLLELKNPPSHIIIETSGLAMPEPLIEAFNWPQIKTKVKIDALITIIDTKALLDGKNAENEKIIEKIRKNDQNLDHNTPLTQLLKDQIVNADLVIMNKSENCFDTKIEKLKIKLNKIANRKLRFIKTSYGKCDPQIILGISTNKENHHHKHEQEQKQQHHEQQEHHQQQHHEHHDHHDHSYFKTITVEFEQAINDKDEFIDKIRDLINHNPEIIRIKGSLIIKNKKFPLIIQAVGKRLQTYFNHYQNTDIKNALVFIGTEDAISECKIKQLLNINPKITI